MLMQAALVLILFSFQDPPELTEETFERVGVPVVA